MKHPNAINLTPSERNAIEADRVQQEVILARSIMRQHPDVPRDEALRVAARIVAREYPGRKGG